MNKLLKTTILLALVFSSIFLGAQTTNKMPLEIAKAFQNGTRSKDGNPGPNYWQNYSDYTINAELNTKESKLIGSESIVYHNCSPDTLKMIVVRLYPDFYKKGNARSWTIGEDDLTDGTIIHKLNIADKDFDLNNRNEIHRSATNMFIFLDKYLLSGDSLEVNIHWEFNIPKKRWARMGNYGNDRFFIAYWYPQIAVYDDIDGWDIIEYYGTVEFYNDFNNYDVIIKTPPGFTVWATGDLENMDQLYTNLVIDKYTKAKETDEIVVIFSTTDLKNDKVLRSKKSNEWHFTANNIPDFTFGTTKFSNWDGTSTVADHSTGRRVFVDVVYPDSVDSFDEGAHFSQESIKFMVDSLPGYPFPYSHMTSFCNGRKSGGMESPMMVNEGDPSTRGQAIGLIFHEILHSYFPFYMGTNERKYAWMDEGWATWLPYGTLNMLEPSDNYFEKITNSFQNLSCKEKEVPLMYLSYQISDYASYRVHSYNRSAMAYAFLRNALGDSIFKLALHTYMDRWNGKHPIPYDFFNTLENVSGQDFNWYIQPWFFDRAYADLGIKKVTFDNKIIIENNGGLPLPVFVKCYFVDGTNSNYYLNTSVWSTGQGAVIIQADPENIIQKVVLGNKEIPDVISENNEIIIVTK
ncbi:MAG: M1 family metallopeptidase [Bacteroidetes bacterium]|nr:M1 family metallopeptidase [Bacteroidota bacterium]MBL6944296.1 M1 family metallopeptidase [Bacteroidales bacterium]